MILKNEELISTTGGGLITGTLINALVRTANVALEIGRSIGTAISMALRGRKC